MLDQTGPSRLQGEPRTSTEEGATRVPCWIFQGTPPSRGGSSALEVTWAWPVGASHRAQIKADPRTIPDRSGSSRRT
jgi:hypothetical protein